jgi:NADPH:quinone reductase-like Zn-dependent oxidoreductase
MRAWLLHDSTGPEAFRLAEVADPTPGPGEVVIDLKVVGLNHLDLWVSYGRPKPPGYPHIVGADGAGVIAALGEGVGGWAVGDEVIIDPSVSCGRCAWCVRDEVVYCDDYHILGEDRPGTLAERIAIGVRNLVRRPASVPWEVAGSYGLATGTAYRMLERAGLRKGETVLVVGVGGGVSSAALLLAKARGARVWVTSRSQAKLDWALTRGAEGGFESSAHYSKLVKEATGRGVDVVIENVGPATWDQSIRSLAPGGRLVICGATSGQKVELNLPPLWFKQMEVIGSTMFNHGEFARATHLVATGVVQIPVDRVYPFEQLLEALSRMEKAEQVGKLALEIDRR